MTDKQEQLYPKRRKRRPAIDRFNEKWELDDNGCWIWTAGTLKARKGLQDYGTFYVGPGRRSELAHRWAYEHFHRPIPEGLTIDHLCGVGVCVNPQHLDAVTITENLRRNPKTWIGRNGSKTHCKYGHEFTPENTTIKPQSMGRPGVVRWCNKCRKESWKREKAKRAA